jgi:hypothetical protein
MRKLLLVISIPFALSCLSVTGIPLLICAAIGSALWIAAMLYDEDSPKNIRNRECINHAKAKLNAFHEYHDFHSDGYYPNDERQPLIKATYKVTEFDPNAPKTYYEKWAELSSYEKQKRLLLDEELMYDENEDQD